MDDNEISNLRLETENIIDLKIALSKSSIEDCLDAFEEFKKSSINLDNKQIQACMFFCICVELECLDKRLDDIQLVFKDAVKVFSSSFLKQYFESMQKEYWFTDDYGVFKAFSRGGFTKPIQDLRLQDSKTISINIITENFDDITIKEDENWPEALNLPTLIKLLEENKQGIYTRKEMLKVNEKALELLSLLRSEIFNYSNFVMRSYDSLKLIETEALFSSKEEPQMKDANKSNSNPSPKKHTLQKELDFTSHSMINFSTTCDFNSNNLHNISSIIEPTKTPKTNNIQHKAIISHILRFNMTNNFRVWYDFQLNKTNMISIKGEVKQDLVKFDHAQVQVYTNKCLEQGILSENHIKQSRVHKKESFKDSNKEKSGSNSRNISVELNSSNSSSHNIPMGKRSVQKYDKEPFSEKDISVIKPNKQVEESRLDNSFEDLLKCDFSKNLQKYRQQTEQNANNTLFNISNVSHRSRMDGQAEYSAKPEAKMRVDDVDFNHINIGKSLNLAKRKESPPSRKIIIAQNKPTDGSRQPLDPKRKTLSTVKTSTNDHLNKIYNLTKEKKPVDDKPKPIKYNFGSTDFTARKKTAQDSHRETSNERSLSKTKSSFKTLVSPRSAASKLVRATDSNDHHQSQSSLTKTLSKEVSRDRISVVKPSKEDTMPIKLFKKNFAKQDEKFQLLSDQLIDRVNMGRKKPQTLSSDRHFGSTKTTFTSQSAKNLQGTHVVKKEGNLNTNNMVRTSTEINFRIKSNKLPELAMLSSRDNKLKNDPKHKGTSLKDKN